MADQSRLISGGVNYYLEGGGKYTGSGTPWTVVTTSPYAIAMNDTAGTSYTPMAAQRQEVYGGGPPFRNGQTLIYDSYGNVTETLTIQCRANSHDNAVALLQQLRKILNTALFTTPCQLAYQPNGATNAVYFEIYGADVQEDARFVNQEADAAQAGSALVRAVVTWRRSPHGGLLSAGETLINAQSMKNTGTGSPDNVDAFSSGAGELIYEGGPLNIKFLPTTASSDPAIVYLASINARSYSTSSAGSSSTSSASFSAIGSSTTFSADALLTARGLKARVIGRFSAMSTNAELYLQYANGANFVQSTRAVIPGASVATIVDFGSLSLPSLFLASVTAAEDIVVSVFVRSTTGGAVAVTLGYLELLLYYDFCKITVNNNTSISVAGNRYLYLDSFVSKTSYPALPCPIPQAWVYESTDTVNNVCSIRGTPPRYFSGASLYAAWMKTTLAHATGDAATISAFHAPLYKTLRGAN
jgi:hypothetical protein